MTLPHHEGSNVQVGLGMCTLRVGNEPIKDENCVKGISQSWKSTKITAVDGDTSEHTHVHKL